MRRNVHFAHIQLAYLAEGAIGVFFLLPRMFKGLDCKSVSHWALGGLDLTFVLARSNPFLYQMCRLGLSCFSF